MRRTSNGFGGYGTAKYKVARTKRDDPAKAAFIDKLVRRKGGSTPNRGSGPLLKRSLNKSTSTASPPSLVCEHCPRITPVHRRNYARHLRKVHGLILYGVSAAVAPSVPQKVVPEVAAKPSKTSPLEHVLLIVYWAGTCTLSLTAQDLSVLPQFPAIDDSCLNDLRAVRLSDLLRNVLLRTRTQPLHRTQKFELVAQSSTGARAVFSWDEIAPVLSERKVFIVGNWAVDAAGPLRLYVPEDEGSYRSLKGVVALHIKEAT